MGQQLLDEHVQSRGFTSSATTPARPQNLVSFATLPRLALPCLAWPGLATLSANERPAAGTTCSNGIDGVESANGKACCVTECGSCGGVGCSQFSPDLGADDCCVTE